MDTVDATPSSQGSEATPAEPLPDAKNDPLEIPSIFVNPAPWILDDMIPVLIRSEIPVYVLNSHNFIPLVCRKFKSAILYVYAERSMGVEKLDWPRLFEDWTNLFIECRTTVVFLDRALSANRQKELRKPGYSTAFIELNQNIRNIMNMIYGIATTLNQKSRRKAIRVNCEKAGTAPEYNVQVNNFMLRGQVRDISSGGMAAYVPADCLVPLVEGSELRSLQLQLKGNRILVTAQLIAVREIAGRRIMVVLFKWGDDKRSKERIHQYITLQLQEILNLALH